LNHKYLIVFFVVSSLATFAACDIKDKVNDETAQTESFEKELDTVPLQAVPGACSPVLLTFDDIMSSLSWWQDARDHLSEVSIESLEYRAPDNNNTTAITIDLYLTDQVYADPTTIPEDDKIASTSEIPANFVIQDWQEMTFAPGAEDRIARSF
jgi:hypothetical protein